MRRESKTKMNMAQTNLSRRDSLKIARRFNAGIGLDCASSPVGTAETARPFRPSLRDKTPARQINLSKLKACWKLAGGKVPQTRDRHPRSASQFITALKGRRNRPRVFPRTPSGCWNFLDLVLGYHPLLRVQPQANFRQPFRLLQTTRN
jgi:hypothetical protein